MHTHGLPTEKMLPANDTTQWHRFRRISLHPWCFSSGYSLQRVYCSHQYYPGGEGTTRWGRNFDQKKKLEVKLPNPWDKNSIQSSLPRDKVFQFKVIHPSKNFKQSEVKEEACIARTAKKKLNATLDSPNITKRQKKSMNQYNYRTKEFGETKWNTVFDLYLTFPFSIVWLYLRWRNTSIQAPWIENPGRLWSFKPPSRGRVLQRKHLKMGGSPPRWGWHVLRAKKHQLQIWTPLSKGTSSRRWNSKLP